ncbi:hypothetical protein [Gulosibacter sp. 10]|uniref:hypothetical protein n=1 Tax=Gulosibacter sp. 10 TaxID=1255570 RepID=UPI000B3547EB|nr:hypothetical protein [Gulosibacter sp. 10]
MVEAPIPGFIFIPGRGTQSDGMPWWLVAVVFVIAGAAVWMDRRRKRGASGASSERAAGSSEAGRAGNGAGVRSTGGSGFTPADLRGLEGPSRPRQRTDAWLLGLAAVEVERHHLDHGRWALAPDTADDRWHRKIDQLLRDLGALREPAWRSALEDGREDLAAAEGEEELAAAVARLAFWIRLGCAAGHASENEARRLTQQAAQPLREAECGSWQKYAALLQCEFGSLRGELSLLAEPGWPWQEGTWR